MIKTFSKLAHAPTLSDLNNGRKAEITPGMITAILHLGEDPRSFAMEQNSTRV